ncbi:MAG: ABC transporter permease [Candidatus Bipolaricaulia bacterium]
MGFLNYVIRRLALQVLVLFGVLVITFLISHLIPGDPAQLIAGPRATQEIIDKIKHESGLDKPLYVQFSVYLKGLFHGSLGTSIRTRRPVVQDIKRHFPATFELVTASFFIILILSIPLGVLSAVYKDRLFDHISRLFSIAGISMPVFWLGLLLLLLFYVKLGWLPGTGRIDIGIAPPSHITGLHTIDALLAHNWEALRNSLTHLILPALTLSYVSLARVVRMLRSSMLEALGQDYIQTARAKGLAERFVLYKHALRNAFIPALTVIGLSYGELLQGAVVTETIFGWPGMAYYAVGSMISLDFPAVMGVTLISAIIYTTINLMVDLFYGFIDPRIRFD